MPDSKLIPMDIAARVVNQSKKVPALDGSPFDSDGAELERGVHLHWSLPDALTRAKANDKEPPRFRGVPDLWLVIRFNPAPPSVANSKRSWRGWIVDSLLGNVTPLAEWQQDPNRDQTMIHTAPGVLKRVASGWGEWEGPVFDPLTVAYYPACRSRLGFHDDLSDLANANGTISYTVIGWHSRPAFDSLLADKNRELGRLMLGPRSDLSAHAIVATPVASGLAASVALDWKPAVQQTARFEISEAKRVDMARSVAEQRTQIAAKQRSLKDFVGAIPVAFGPANPQEAAVDFVAPGSLDTYTICHGSIMDVPLRERFLGRPEDLPKEDLKLYPNVQRAMAEVASRTGQGQQTDWLEMMMGDLGQQAGSVGGVVDLAGAQHARTFQSVPGQSKFFARIDVRPPLRRKFNGNFALKEFQIGVGAKVRSGHWPEMLARSASDSLTMIETQIPAVSLFEPAGPPQPTAAEIVSWIAQVRAAFDATQAAATAAGTPIDARMIRLQDHREKAQPTPMGRSTDGNGPAQAGWWIDIDDDISLGELRKSIHGARVHLPDVANLFEVPGARWYRPWAPHLVIYGTKRSYRHGFDGRFRQDGHLKVRRSGEAMLGFKSGKATVLGASLIAKPETLGVAGLPLAAGELLQEHALLDSENAGIMAMTAILPREGAPPRDALAKQMVSSVRSVWLSRDSKLTAPQKNAIDNVAPMGEPSSAAGLQAWKDWYGPIFLDAEYTHQRKPIDPGWKLPPEHIEMVEVVPGIAPDATNILTERRPVTVTVTKVLKSTLVTNVQLDPYGKPVKKQPSPTGVNEETFERMDVVSASLTGMDPQLFAAGLRERGGAMHVNKVRLYDAFGDIVPWNSGVADPAQPVFNPMPDWANPLPPRIPAWARLNFRLQTANDPNVEATALTPPICGIMLPDFVDQALEIFDGTGEAIGQVRADDPVEKGAAVETTLTATFAPHPWVAATLPAGADPLDAIVNDSLKKFVAALLAQPIVVPAGAANGNWFETGFTAMLRVIDTIRGTLDPTKKVPDHKVRLLGEPILLMNVRLSYEVSNVASEELKRAPELVTAPPNLPVLRVRIGDVTRPDDGVLGCFLPGATPEESRFAPTSLQASTEALLNQMVFETPAQKKRAVTHPFIQDQVAEFDLPANEPLDRIILADSRGSLYVTCGVVPRKLIVPPRDFVDSGLKNLDPTFAVGPILSYTRAGSLVPVLPPPRIEGMDSRFVHDSGPAFPEVAIPPVPPIAELPVGRVRLTEGWVRMSKTKPA